MSNEPHSTQNKNYNPNTPIDNKEYFGMQSCASCRYIDYNGQVCGHLLSPRSGSHVKQKNWCRYWSPKMQNAPFRK
mgnify:CR=1 FL=1